MNGRSNTLAVSDVVGGKKQIRQQVRRLRTTGLTQAGLRAKSKIIVQQCINNIPWQKLKTVHTYIPITKLNEVDTWPLITYLRSYQPHIQTFTSIVGPDKSLIVVQLDSETEVDTKQLAMTGSKSSIAHYSGAIDLIIVPMMAFDRQGNRIGYGQGYYDRFLARYPNAHLLGLCFELGFVRAGIPAEDHDIRMHRIITEERIVSVAE